MSHPIENIMKTSMEQIKEMVDVNTIIGSAILTDQENMILPVSKVSLGFLSGGGEYGAASPVRRSGEALDGNDIRYPFAGTSVVGMSLTPMAFLAVNNNEVKVHPANYSCSVDRLIELLPNSIERIIQQCKCNQKSSCSQTPLEGAELQDQE